MESPTEHSGCGSGYFCISSDPTHEADIIWLVMKTRIFILTNELTDRPLYVFWDNSIQTTTRAAYTILETLEQTNSLLA